MLLAQRFARLSRRRRRCFSPALVESLETRELMAVGVTASAVAAHPAAYDLHAQYLRLVQLNGGATPHHVVAAATHATATHVAASHAASTRTVTAAVVTRGRTHAGSAALQTHLTTDFVKYDTTDPTAGDGADDGTGDLATYAPVIGAYTPAQVRTAYGVSALGLANQGQGTTIAIIDAYDDPNITSDANVFSSQYNLPQFDGQNGDPSLTVYQDTSAGAVATAVGTGIAGETSLDVEWAHAMAPRANILLVEVANTSLGALLEGIQYAALQPGVVAASLSYGGSERGISSASLIAADNYYLGSAPATNIAVTVSTGDGSSPSYPATSPNVIGVGGSSLFLASVRGRYSLETAWGGLAGAGGGGGGLSTNFTPPTFQSANGVTYARRAIPDVSMIADPVTGVSYYDSLDVTASAPDPWGAVGGTSLAAPVFAGVVALAQQNRIAAGLSILNSTQINAETYAVYNSPSYSTYFRDINLGNNSNVSGTTGRITVTGYTATTGYDLATGVGSPIVNTYVPLLSSL